MKIKLDPANPRTWPKGRIKSGMFDATTESELAAQQASDDEAAIKDAAQAIEANRNAARDVPQKR